MCIVLVIRVESSEHSYDCNILKRISLVLHAIDFLIIKVKLVGTLSVQITKSERFDRNRNP